MELTVLNSARIVAGIDSNVQNVMLAARSPMRSLRYSSTTSTPSVQIHRTRRRGANGGRGARGSSWGAGSISRSSVGVLAGERV